MTQFFQICSESEGSCKIHLKTLIIPAFRKMLIIWVILTELKQWEIKLNYSNLMWVSFHLFYILNVWLLLFSVEVINSLCPCCCSKPLKPSSSSNKPLPFIKVIEIRSWENRRTWQPEQQTFFQTEFRQQLCWWPRQIERRIRAEPSQTATLTAPLKPRPD